MEISTAGLMELAGHEGRRTSLERRLREKIDQRGPDECWPWLARARHAFGYGVINAGRGHLFLAHRVAWFLANGPIPSGAYVLHSCDNPACCNPGHLRLGDHADNMADMKARGRRLGVPVSEETRRKIREGRAKNPPVLTEAGRISVANAMRARWERPEWRAHMAKINARRPTP